MRRSTRTGAFKGRADHIYDLSQQRWPVTGSKRGLLPTTDFSYGAGFKTPA
jgi:hypothetical protein